MLCRPVECCRQKPPWGLGNITRVQEETVVWSGGSTAPVSPTHAREEPQVVAANDFGGVVHGKAPTQHGVHESGKGSVGYEEALTR